jgi:hypothetical protein
MAYTTINDPTKYFQAKKYTGNGTVIGSGGLAVTLDSDTDLQPDLVWSKNKDDATGHRWTDSVRGVTQQFYSNNANAEATDSEGLTSFNSDGFTVGGDDGWNTSGEDVRAWNWKAGTSFTNDASSTSIGSIDSAGSASAASGFSIVTTTGTGSAGTIKHGLSTAPAMIIGKRRDADNSNWRVYHKDLSSNSHILYLDTTSAEEGSNSATWNNTTPTTSVFSVGNSGDVNASGATIVFYCFAEKQGFNKFGKYIGNNNADGPFVYCGFKPAFVMLKNISATQNWFIYDNKDFGINTVVDATNNRPLFANEPDTSASAGMYKFLFLSNGFKVIESGAQTNGSGNTFVYMAFAEAPFTNSNGVPSNAE